MGIVPLINITNATIIDNGVAYAHPNLIEYSLTVLLVGIFYGFLFSILTMYAYNKWILK